MFGMFPFLFNNNSNSNNNYGRNNGDEYNIFDTLLSDDFMNGMVDQLLSSDVVNNLVGDMLDDDYDVELKDFGDYYLIRGYLPGLTPKDVSIDFEKNKAILTIKRKKTYSNGRNSMVTVVQTGGNCVKNFYIGEVDVTKLKASFDNSLLLITMPKIKKLDNEVKNNDTPTIIDVDNYKIE